MKKPSPLPLWSAVSHWSHHMEEIRTLCSKAVPFGRNGQGVSTHKAFRYLTVLTQGVHSFARCHWNIFSRRFFSHACVWRSKPQDAQYDLCTRFSGLANKWQSERHQPHWGNIWWVPFLSWVGSLMFFSSLLQIWDIALFWGISKNSIAADVLQVCSGVNVCLMT